MPATAPVPLSENAGLAFLGEPAWAPAILTARQAEKLHAAANPWIDVAIPTGLGEARNALVVRTADAIVAVGGEYGTLSEIALALRAGKPVVGLGTWGLIRPGGAASTDIITAPDSAAAADLAMVLAIAHLDE